MPPLVLWIKFVILLIIFQLFLSFNQNFGRQKFFPLAMATNMVAAWSAEWFTKWQLFPYVNSEVSVKKIWINF